MKRKAEEAVGYEQHYEENSESEDGTEAGSLVMPLLQHFMHRKAPSSARSHGTQLANQTTSPMTARMVTVKGHERATGPHVSADFVLTDGMRIALIDCNLFWFGVDMI